MRKNCYAKEITREYLESLGIVEVNDEAMVFRKRKDGFLQLVTPHKNNAGYYTIALYDHKRYLEDRRGTVVLPLHRVMWAWKKGVAHAEMVIDHINNQHQSLGDYRMENLQEITPGENLRKDRTGNYGRSDCYKMPKYVQEADLDYVKGKVAEYQARLEQAKADHDAKSCHALRMQVARWKSFARRKGDEQ